MANRMKSLKITIKPISSFVSRIQSDTFFGQFAWTYRELYGEEKLKADIIDKQPSIIFSDGFPAGYLPYPILKPLKENYFNNIIKEKSNWEQEAYIKEELKKKEFISADLLEDIAANIFSEALADKVLLDKKDYNTEDKKEDFLISEKVYKNSINRYTGTTEIKGGLYGVLESFFDIEKKEEKRLIDIYMLYDSGLNIKLIKEAIMFIGINGFGKNKSTGKGRFETPEYEEDPKGLNNNDPKKDYNGIISLSTAVLSGNLKVNYAKIFTKFPKHGGDLATSGKYIKKPAIFYKAGSTFRLKKDNETYNYGDNLKLFHPKYKGHIHNARMVPYYIKLKDSGVKENG